MLAAQLERSVADWRAKFGALLRPLRERHAVQPSPELRRARHSPGFIGSASAGVSDAQAGYAAATLRAISNSAAGIGTDSRHVNATGRSPRWST